MLVSDNSVQLFSKLGWIPVDNIGKCRDYFNEYSFSVNDKHRYNTRASTNNFLITPSFIQNLVTILFMQVVLKYGIHQIIVAKA